MGSGWPGRDGTALLAESGSPAATGCRGLVSELGVHLVRILGTDDQPIDLLLIPVDITPATAELALTDVEVEQTADIDGGPAAADLVARTLG